MCGGGGGGGGRGEGEGEREPGRAATTSASRLAQISSSDNESPSANMLSLFGAPRSFAFCAGAPRS